MKAAMPDHAWMVQNRCFFTTVTLLAATTRSDVIDACILKLLQQQYLCKWYLLTVAVAMG
jgi:hypothetical protein